MENISERYKLTKISKKQIKKEDLLTGAIEVISTDELIKMFENYLSTPENYVIKLKNRKMNVKFELDEWYKKITWYEKEQKAYKKEDKNWKDDSQYGWLRAGEYKLYFENLKYETECKEIKNEGAIERKKYNCKKTTRELTVYDYHVLYSWLLSEIDIEFRDAVANSLYNTLKMKLNKISRDNLISLEISRWTGQTAKTGQEIMPGFPAYT